jgi:hypothetical protein
MTVPQRPDQYELYRVILDYEALQDGFLDRIDDLDTTLEQIEIGGELAKGNAQKLLTKNPGKHSKRDRHLTSGKRAFGWESLGKMLKGTGLALVLVVDDERFAPLKEQLAKRRRVNKPPNGSSKRPTWLFTRSKSLKMQVLRNQALSPKQRKRIARMAGKASGKARRKSLAPQRPAALAANQV